MMKVTLLLGYTLFTVTADVELKIPQRFEYSADMFHYRVWASVILDFQKDYSSAYGLNDLRDFYVEMKKCPPSSEKLRFDWIDIEKLKEINNEHLWFLERRLELIGFPLRQELREEFYETHELRTMLCYIDTIKRDTILNVRRTLKNLKEDYPRFYYLYEVPRAIPIFQ